MIGIGMADMINMQACMALTTAPFSWLLFIGAFAARWGFGLAIEAFKNSALGWSTSSA